MQRKIYQENFGKVIEMISGSLAFLTSILYVALQYIETTPGEINYIFDRFDYSVCCVFLGIYALKGYVATHRF